MEQSSCLVVWEGCVAGTQLLEVLQAENVDLDSSVLCSGLSGCGGRKPGGFSKGICLVNGGEGPRQDVLIAMCEMLKPGAVLSVLVGEVGYLVRCACKRSWCWLAGFHWMETKLLGVYVDGVVMSEQNWDCLFELGCER